MRLLYRPTFLVTRSIPPLSLSTRYKHKMATSRDSPRPEFSIEPAFKYTQPPNKDWKIGQKFNESGTSAIATEWAKGSEAGYKTFDLEKEDAK
jgi:hypothetical protein